MRKNGKTSAGRQRWRCDACRSSGVARRDDGVRMAQFRAFLRWVTGTVSMREAAEAIGVSRRTFPRAIDWCWNVRPRIGADGVVHRFVEVDGTYVPHGWCMLVAIGEDGRPIGWQWCHRENRSAYDALLRSLTRPDLLVCDGAAACLRAAAGVWPGVPVQRCLAHTLRNTFADLTRGPRSEAGRELLALIRRLPGIHDPGRAAGWLAALNDWHARHGGYIKERTYARTDPGNPKARAGRTWWWTHERLRRAYFRIIAMQREGTLFAHLEQDGDPPNNTNRLEGGVNADLKRRLDAHRGLSPEHTKRCCEWVVYMKSANPDPERFMTPDCWDERKPPPRPAGEPAPGTWTQMQLPCDEPDTHEPGFGIRKGWGGRS